MKKSHRDKSGRFFNPWSPKTTRSLPDLLKWLVFSKNRFRAEKKRPFIFPTERPDFAALDQTGKDYLVWLGHSTVVIRAAGKTIITDPVLWNINPLIRRKTALPVSPEELPRVDWVFISHGHYDHLNTRSVRFLIERSDPLFITGPGYARYLRRAGARRHVELDWWQTYREGVLQVTSLPVQHWSKRGPFDTNRMLWCSFLVESDTKKYYWVGDSGYYPGFKEIGKVYGPVDVALLPIGAFEPRWFMEPFHMSPDEALQAAIDVRARVMIPIHWGTFDLTDEPLWLPAERLEELRSEDDDTKIAVLKHGGHYVP